MWANYVPVILDDAAISENQSFYGGRPETRPDALKRPLRDVTWAWGESYPCGGYDCNSGHRCSGWMIPASRCFRYLGKGRLWRRFNCSVCGRLAHDWKTQ